MAQLNSAHLTHVATIGLVEKEVGIFPAEIQQLIGKHRQRVAMNDIGKPTLTWRNAASE